ncbi:MAG: type II secretion system F family protein [Bryobacteraceae bacterium]
MIEALTIIVFLAAAAAPLALALRRRLLGARLAARFSARPAVAPLPEVSHYLSWRELVRRVGELAPFSATDAAGLRKRLIRAGFRDPGAVKVFHGIRILSVALLAGAGLLVALHTGRSPLAGIAAGACAGLLLPMQVLMRRVARRAKAIQRGLPNALDLMVICVESGLGLDQTNVQVAKELAAAHPEISDEFTVMNLELRAGKRRAEALHNLAERAGVEDLRKLVAVLIQTDRFGTSVAQSLRGHADYMRTQARQRAEERASKLAVKLVFPIFFCILPSLFVVTVGPVITRVVRELLPMLENL